MKHGPICSTGDVKQILKKFEKDGRLAILRNPDMTVKGKPTAFMSEEKENSVCEVDKLKIKKFIQRKTLIYKTEVEYGDYTMNHVLGCSHGCLLSMLCIFTKSALVM